MLFLQALTLEAGALDRAAGRRDRLRGGRSASFVLVVALERKLPHKKMLIATGLMITVGARRARRADRADAAEGRLGARDADRRPRPAVLGRSLARPLPDLEGLVAQAAALAFVIGSYFAAEVVRNRRRARILAAPIGAQRVDA